MSVIVEPEDAILEPARQKHIQSHPPIPAGSDYRYPYLFVEADTLYLNFRFRCRSGCFGLSYGALLPIRKLLAVPGSLAPFLASCDYNYIVSPAFTGIQLVVDYTSKEPPRALPRR